MRSIVCDAYAANLAALPLRSWRHVPWRTAEGLAMAICVVAGVVPLLRVPPRTASPERAQAIGAGSSAPQEPKIR